LIAAFLFYQPELKKMWAFIFFSCKT